MRTATKSTLQDAVVIGGSYAGLSAAMQLARARRRVLVIDDGRPRNRYASHAHGVLANDGRPGAEITQTAREQLQAYPTATVHVGEAVETVRTDDGFVVTLAEGEAVTGRRLILAHGVEDVLPDIPGVRERWGVTTLHCPWCHGYEVGGGPIGVLGRGPMAAHYASVVSEWGETTLFLSPDLILTADEASLLKKRGVTIERTAIAALEGAAPKLSGARLTDGRFMGLKALFVGASVRQTNRFAEALGCEMTDTPMGRIVKVDAQQRTTQPGIFAAGDAARAAGNITLASADGVLSAYGVFQSLLEEETR